MINLHLPASGVYADLVAVFDDSAAAMTMLRDADAASEGWPTKLHDIALLAAYFGDAALALRLEAEKIRYAPMRLQFMREPLMDDARRLTGFKQLVIDIGLVDYWREFGWANACRPIGDTDFVRN
jgi:hypothetical protein